MNSYKLAERKPTVDEFVKLRNSVSWGIPTKEAVVKGLDNSLYGVVAIANDEVIGMIRVVGDWSTCFYIQDVIVDPRHQGKGIGKGMMKKVMEFISGNACEGAIVGLMAARGKEEFYEKFGFWKRPNENFGHGMMQFWENKL
ncbi:MAG: GNAT family N-acetyltransferase [Bacillota bacterium]|nr:GNAT family N-acetyltransferase [Bacillota bacterium]